jgi:hypothetical protein
MRKIVVLICLALCGLNALCQDSGIIANADTTIQTPVSKKPTVPKPRFVHRDSIPKVDSTLIPDSTAHQDSVLIITKEHAPGISLFRPQNDTNIAGLNSFIRFTDPMHYSITIKKWQGKEAIFYSMIALLIFFALIRNGFNRYVNDLFKTYFRTTVKQKQTKEQLQQSPLPSLLLNSFFVLSIGMYLALLFQYFKLGLEFNFWLLYLYCVLGLIGIYAIKFVSLKFFGWIFQVAESTDSYIFIVFTTNKIIGMCLLPFLVVITFTYGVVNEAAVSLSVMVVLGLLVYRFFLSFISIRRQISIGFLHFLLYLFAFELIPLLLINKLLFSFLGETY